MLFYRLCFLLVAVMLGARTNLHLTIPDFMIGPFFVSFVAFPIVSIIKIGYRRLLQKSKLTQTDGMITYDRLAEKCGQPWDERKCTTCIVFQQ